MSNLMSFRKIHTNLRGFKKIRWNLRRFKGIEIDLTGFEKIQLNSTEFKIIKAKSITFEMPDVSFQMSISMAAWRGVAWRGVAWRGGPYYGQPNTRILRHSDSSSCTVCKRVLVYIHICVFGCVVGDHDLETTLTALTFQGAIQVVLRMRDPWIGFLADRSFTQEYLSSSIPIPLCGNCVRYIMSMMLGICVIRIWDDANLPAHVTLNQIDKCENNAFYNEKNSSISFMELCSVIA